MSFQMYKLQGSTISGASGPAKAQCFSLDSANSPFHSFFHRKNSLSSSKLGEFSRTPSHG
jgi:hypothetical protein